MRLFIHTWCCVFFAAALSCPAAPLKEAFRYDFQIGTALGSRDVKHHYIYPMRRNANELKLVCQEFNCITAENLMKCTYLQPREGFFNFEQADEFVKFAVKHDLAVVGHALVWHSQAPDWLFKDAAGNPVSRDLLIQRMRTHIHTVMKRYKGKIQYWDVVNEAVVTRMVDDESLPPDEEGNPQKKQIAVYRDSPWLQIIGEEYIELAFRFAHEADPDAKLLYNDYSMTGVAKAEFVAEMVKGIKARGVPVHGIGMQGHWHLDYPSTEELQHAITLFAGTGAKVSITELEIGVLPNAHNHTGADINDIVEAEEDLNPYVDGAPDEVLEQHALRYQDIFRVLIGNRDRIERVTFWGISDGYSWKNNYPVRGRTDYPLLFDRRHQPKPAYKALVELAANED